MKPAPHQITTSVVLPLSLRGQLDALAAEKERSRSWIAAQAIREYVERHGASRPDPAA